MTNQYKLLFCFYLTLVLSITSFSYSTIKQKNIEISRLKKSRKKLEERITNYEWQIEQVPYIIESWCNGE